jgi:ATP-binding cassette subfamily B protein
VTGRQSDLALYRRIASETRGYRVHIGVIFALSLLAAPLALLTPVPLKIAVDSVLGPHPLPGFLGPVVPDSVERSDDALLVFAALMFLVIAVLTQVQDLGTTVLKTYTGEKLVLGFRGKLFQQSQRLSLAYHDRIGTSDSTYRVQEDAKSLQYIAVESLISLIAAAATLAAMIYVTARIDLQLALIAVCVSPPLLLIARHFRPRMRDTSREVKRFESGALSVVQEVLTGLRVVKAFGQEDREQERYVGRASEGMRARIRLAVLQGGYAVMVAALIGAGSGLVLLVGVRAVQSGRMTLGDLLLVMGYLTQLYAPLRTMARKAGSLQNHLASAERAFGLLDEAPEVPQRPDALPLRRAAGHVEFRDVCFEYEPGRPVLTDVSFSVEPGSSVGIAGATGAGKTTLMSLLLRFHDPGTGRILLDGVDLRDYEVADLRNQFGIVLQEPVLFSTTIAENIAYARPDASQRDIEAASAAASIHDFIVGLPEGYDTQVGERGMRLSGGERQRISLARAFLKDAQLLILDEPTSSVDVETEAIILEAMERLMAGRTTFMIAHRLSTLDVCDQRLQLDKGRLVAGSPRSRHGRRGSARQASRRRIQVPAGSGSNRNGGAVVSSGRLSDHPAVKAWIMLAGKKPLQVRLLKGGKRRKRGTYRLEGAGPNDSAVIAKLCRRKTAEVETAVYEKLLPLLPTPSVRFYGAVQDGDREHCWLFLEDAGGGRYSPAAEDHRRLAARWLATVQLHADEVLETSDLPDRGPRHYLVHLLNAREEIARQLRRHQAGSEDAQVLGDLLSKLDRLESQWGELTGFCDTLPQTLVHGDFVSKNLRITHDGGGIGLAIFDWETAGLGSQAPDLAQTLEPDRSDLAARPRSKHFSRFSANPCLETYHSELTASGFEVEHETLELSAAVGNLFRCLAGTDWACSEATASWCPIDDLRLYSKRLGDAARVIGRLPGRTTKAAAGEAR